jgi:hypothetical protein
VTDTETLIADLTEQECCAALLLVADGEWPASEAAMAAIRHVLSQTR